MGNVASRPAPDRRNIETKTRSENTAGAVVRRILFPTDLSEESAGAFEHARLLAEAFDANLTLYHALEPPRHEEPHWAFDSAEPIWRAAERLARHDLERRAADLKAHHDIQVERCTSAHRALVDLIHATRPDVVVMATHGREGLAHLFLGSVTEKVVQHGHRPVLCVRRGPRGVTLPYRRILVPTDFSPASLRAFPLAALLARAFAAEIIAFHATPERTLATLSGIPAHLPQTPSEAELWEHFQRDFAGLTVTAQIHEGSPWRQIAHIAEVERVDLIVMSTQGHHSLGDRIVGSNTERVVRHAPCPVLVA
jgi:nucleotide-binding universal stress UspA family protein